MNRDDEIAKLEKALGTRRFLTNYISIPCTVICGVMMLASVGKPMMLFWLVMFLFNGFAVLANSAACNIIERGIEALGQHDRRKKVDELYGRSNED